MNPHPESDPRALRAEIDQTRRRMDQTIDALGQRFAPRHLADEALGYLRNQTQNGNMRKIRHQFAQSAETAMHSVTDTVKSNPIPAALIGAGIVYYFYSQNQQSDDRRGYVDPASFGEIDPYSEAGYGSEDPGLGQRLGEKAGELKERSREAIHQAGEKMHRAGERVRERAREVTARARERASYAGERTRQLARDGRERAAQAYQQHPLESGLACLALGMIAGLALPTSPRVRRQLRPRAERLRHQAEEFVAKGKSVARSAVHAAKQEAQSQGLTAPMSGSGPQTSGAPNSAGNEQDLFGRPQTGSAITQPITP